MSLEPTNLTMRAKLSALEKGLQGEYIMVHINTKKDAALDVPSHLLKTPTLTLKLSHYFKGHLKIDKTLIKAQLSFGELNYECTIPISSIWGVSFEDGQLHSWPEDIPMELLYQGIQDENNDNKTVDTALEDKEKPTQKKEKKTSHLKRIK